MSDRLDEVIARVRGLPPATQDEVAQLLLDWIDARRSEVDDRPAEPIAPEDLAAVAEGLEDARAGRIASDAEVEAAFAAFRSGR